MGVVHWGIEGSLHEVVDPTLLKFCPWVKSTIEPIIKFTRSTHWSPTREPPHWGSTVDLSSEQLRVGAQPTLQLTLEHHIGAIRRNVAK